MDELPKRLLEVAQRLKGGNHPKKYKVRAVLKWFGAERCGARILSDIKAALATLDLETQPPLDDAGIDEINSVCVCRFKDRKEDRQDEWFG